MRFFKETNRRLSRPAYLPICSKDSTDTYPEKTLPFLKFNSDKCRWAQPKRPYGSTTCRDLMGCAHRQSAEFIFSQWPS